ncbi:MAG: Rrf2 family transcriptional regulator [Campylobacterota bacterium]|nr:Rrf2 family transcriptional regulator [Campylobacterota bacterium]
MIGISNKTVYAVAAMQELSKYQNDKVLKIKEIAANANIPQNFLEQILLELKKQNLLTSIKGAYGGYKLSCDLKDVTLKDIILILESDSFSDVCKTDNVGLKLFWDDVRNKITEAFNIPLSELKNYQLQANQVLNYTI